MLIKQPFYGMQYFYLHEFVYSIVGLLENVQPDAILLYPKIPYLYAKILRISKSPEYFFVISQNTSNTSNSFGAKLAKLQPARNTKLNLGNFK